jgi:tRNA U34 2-thiouridine synthase MnmA/TrmU
VSVISGTVSKSLFDRELTKPEVRLIATERELITAEKKRLSRTLFRKVRLPEFLQQKTTS